jgi:hypothetical protein
MLLKLKFCVALFVFGASSACGKSSSSQNAPLPAEETKKEEPSPQAEPTSTEVCEEKWQNYRKRHPVGAFETYRTKLVVKPDELKLNYVYRYEVEFNNEKEVGFKYSSESQTYSNIFKKELVLDDCLKAQAPFPFEEGSESIQVPAGSFDAQWTLARFDHGEGYVNFQKRYFIKDKYDHNLMIKYITETPTAIATIELLETNRLP